MLLKEYKIFINSKLPNPVQLSDYFSKREFIAGLYYRYFGNAAVIWPVPFCITRPTSSVECKRFHTVTTLQFPCQLETD